jgi:crotonobetainyl-CoA:carnitine CoA-transferase CaiB-like acyl-CoA transferase
MYPLEGIRIIAVEQYGAGPFGSFHLASLGAEVIKIEDPTARGDIGRYVSPHAESGHSLFFETFNRNKRSILLDIRTDGGRSVLHDLVRDADAIYSNLRGDVPAELGITYDTLKAVNPAIVCCSLSAYGLTGPRRQNPGYDYMIQALAGWMDLTGEVDGPPSRSGLPLVDYSGGLVAALSLLSGVHAARRDGVGMDCDVSLYDTAIGLLGYLATWYLTAGDAPVRTRQSAHPSLVPFQNFETSDGWIVVGCAKEKFWERLAEAIDHAELASDERFSSFDARRENAHELLPLLETVFCSRPSAEWIERLEATGVPCGTVNTLATALAEPQTTAREMVVEVEHPVFGTVRQVASPVKVGRSLPPPRRAPFLNEDFDYVVHEVLGYESGRIASLCDSGAFGPNGGRPA